MLTVIKFDGLRPPSSSHNSSAFLHLLSGTLCHSISEILLPFRCLNPDSNSLVHDWQLSASRISAVFSPPPPPPPTTHKNVLLVLLVSRSLRETERGRKSAGNGRDGGGGGGYECRDLGSFSYTSCAGFIFIWGVSLTHPMLASFLSGEFLLNIPCWLHFYVGSFSYTSYADFVFV